MAVEIAEGLRTAQFPPQVACQLALQDTPLPVQVCENPIQGVAEEEGEEEEGEEEEEEVVGRWEGGVNCRAGVGAGEVATDSLGWMKMWGQPFSLFRFCFKGIK